MSKFQINREAGVIPISEMWAWWPCWCVFRDVADNWCDVTGHVIHETTSEYVIGNRPDHRKYEIPKSQVELIEEV